MTKSQMSSATIHVQFEDLIKYLYHNNREMFFFSSSSTNGAGAMVVLIVLVVTAAITRESVRQQVLAVMVWRTMVG